MVKVINEVPDWNCKFEENDIKVLIKQISSSDTQFPQKGAHSSPQRFRKAKNRDVGIEPLARSAHSFASAAILALLCAQLCSVIRSFCPRTPLRSFIHSLAHLLASELVGKCDIWCLI